MKNNISRVLIPYGAVVLGLIGLAVSFYLGFKEYTGAEIGTCPIFGAGCGDVLHSKYSKLFGIPLSYYGILFYTCVTIFGGLYAITQKRLFRQLIAIFALVGFVDSVGFVYIQTALIGAYCFYCIISAITTTLLFFLMLPTIIDKVLRVAENGIHPRNNDT